MNHIVVFLIALAALPQTAAAQSAE
jgi:hypothetical protein